MGGKAICGVSEQQYCSDIRGVFVSSRGESIARVKSNAAFLLVAAGVLLSPGPPCGADALKRLL